MDGGKKTTGEVCFCTSEFFNQGEKEAYTLFDNWMEEIWKMSVQIRVGTSWIYLLAAFTVIFRKLNETPTSRLSIWTFNLYRKGFYSDVCLICRTTSIFGENFYRIVSFRFAFFYYWAVLYMLIAISRFDSTIVYAVGLQNRYKGYGQNDHIIGIHVLNWYTYQFSDIYPRFNHSAAEWISKCGVISIEISVFQVSEIPLCIITKCNNFSLITS